MIEEAAGTRMYESKRTSAQRTIEKKDSKLREIEVVRSLLKLKAEALVGGLCSTSETHDRMNCLQHP